MSTTKRKKSKTVWFGMKLTPEQKEKIRILARNRGVSQKQAVLDTSEGQEKIANIVNTYRDLPASFADACLVYLSESKQQNQIITLDNHFSVYRTSKGKLLTLISTF